MTEIFKKSNMSVGKHESLSIDKKLGVTGFVLVIGHCQWKNKSVKSWFWIIRLTVLRFVN